MFSSVSGIHPETKQSVKNREVTGRITQPADGFISSSALDIVLKSHVCYYKSCGRTVSAIFTSLFCCWVWLLSSRLPDKRLFWTGQVWNLLPVLALFSVLLINAVRFEPSIKSTQDKWIRKWSSWIQRAQRGSLPSSWMTHFNDCNLILMAVIQRGGFETCWSFAQRRIAGFLKSCGRIAVRYDTNLLKKSTKLAKRICVMCAC